MVFQFSDLNYVHYKILELIRDVLKKCSEGLDEQNSRTTEVSQYNMMFCNGCRVNATQPDMSINDQI